MRKSIITCVLLSVIFLGSINVFATIPQTLRRPESNSINGLLPNGQSIYDTKNASPIVRPAALLGYEYVPGYEKIANKSIDYIHAYIYGTSISYVSGASPTYQLTVSKEQTRSTTWNVSGSLGGEFDISKVKTKLQLAGGYSNTTTAKISKGETWNCGFQTPGLYNLEWYMRAHKYDAFCGAKILSTGSDHGNFTSYYLGKVTFPTEEIHFDVSKAR